MHAASVIVNDKADLSLKSFYYLISTMNNMFPDYEFADLPPQVFTRHHSLPNLVKHVNTAIFNLGLDTSFNASNDFCRKMWDCINDAVGGLEDCEVFSFNTDGLDTIDDPFKERGTM